MKFVNVKEWKSSVKAEKAELENPSFHNSVGPALFIAQFFGAMPVCGVLAKDEESVKFKWLSVNTIYSIIFLICGTIESSLGTRRILRLGFNVHFAESLMFFITAMIRAFMFFKLAREWKTVIKYWRKCEEPFLRHPYTVTGWSLTKTIRVVFFFLMSLSICESNSTVKNKLCKTFSIFSAEHLLYLANALNDNRLQLLYCTPKSTIFWKNYLARERPHLLYHFPYTPYELPVYLVS